jgi:tetratricopeptide (TPR) repeat protein
MLLLAAMLAGCFVFVAFHYWRQLGSNEALNLDDSRLFVRWTITGLIFPTLLWLAFNVGWPGVPVWPTVQPIRAGFLPWWNSFVQPAAAGTFYISSYWAGITFLWLLTELAARAEDRNAFRRTVLYWSFVLVPVLVVMVFLGKWPAVGMALMICGLLLVHNAVALRELKPALPSYARAQARISFGRYDEAEMEVIRELEEFEDDFDGWMLLAELYATHFNDLASADQTVRDLCEHPSTTPVQLGIALNRLADWHLKQGHDPVAARRALEQLCARLPGTHIEKMARQRIAQLPASREALLAQERGQPMRLPKVGDELNMAPALPRDEAVREANTCVALLTRNPDDVPARERFAQLLANSLGERQAAIEQLELLLALGGQPPEKRSAWLLASAGWHASDAPEKARLIYEQIVRDFPGTLNAFAAQRRLNLLQLQMRLGRRAAQA